MAWPIDSAARRAHEFEWHRLTSHVGLSQLHIGPEGLQEIDMAALGDDLGWIILPDNVPEIATGLRYHAGMISLALNSRWGHEEAESFQRRAPTEQEGSSP